MTPTTPSVFANFAIACWTSPNVTWPAAGAGTLNAAAAHRCARRRAWPIGDSCWSRCTAARRAVAHRPFTAHQSLREI
ncbi:hypothetical protein [Nonomuraea sp. B19D2]|uniref:hypothetical protein n=1 Tax=Nonomuraea sp. B19D2 TaxID=3159561 RepID=UPI0032DBEF2F